MSEAMGVQPASELLALLRQCEATDGGVMVERRTGELGFDSLNSRINLATSLTLDYASQHIDALAPTDDDLLTANDVTVTRIGGTSARLEKTDGPMGTDPETGAGRYEKSLSLSLYEDSQARHHAGLHMTRGTVDGYRYPRLQVKLHNSRLSALVDSIAAVDVSDRITVTNLPANMPPDDVDLMVEGYTEVINSFEWTIAFNCSPYAPYFVFTLDDDVLGRLQTSGSELGIGIDSDDTSLTVVTLADYRPWINSTDHSAQFPFYAWLGGEVVTVTAISGSTSPQTFTVTRSVNGVTKAHSAGTSVRVARVGA